MNELKFGDEWFKALRDYEEQEENALRERHMAGDCGDLDAGCTYCREDQAKAQACVNAFLPLAEMTKTVRRFDEIMELLMPPPVKRCEWWCASLHQPHEGACFEMYSHQDTCPGAPDCVHDDEEIVDRAKAQACADAFKPLAEAIKMPEGHPLKPFYTMDAFIDFFKVKP